MDRYNFCSNNKKTPFLDGKLAKDTRSSEVVWIKVLYEYIFRNTFEVVVVLTIKLMKFFLLEKRI